LYNPRVYSIGALEDRLDSPGPILQLDKFYDKAMRFIGGSDDVLCMLRWLLVLPRRLADCDYERWEKKHPTQRQGPLSAQELRHAIATRVGRTTNLATLQRYMVPLAPLVESSGGLCDFAQSGFTISFTHPTVQEYLMTNSELKISGLAEYKCRACIQYLSMDPFKAGACTEMGQWLARLEEFPFLEYAARNWCIVRGMTDDWESVNAALESAITAFLADAGLVSSLQQVIGYSQGRMRNKQIYIPQTTGLMIAMQFNLLNVMETMCQSGANVNARTESGLTALDLAVTATPEFVELLLRYGAQVKDGTGRNALRVMLFDLPTRRMRGAEEIVRMLVEKDQSAMSISGQKEIDECLSHVGWSGYETMMEAERTIEKQVQVETILEILGLDKDGPEPPWWKKNAELTD
jgi:hypothetical protein